MFAEPQQKNASQLQSPQSQSPHIQPKLEVGAKDDPQEKEADAVAESVMRMSESSGAAGDTAAVKTQQESPMARLLRRHPDAPRPQSIRRYADAPKAPSIQRAPATVAGPPSPVRKKEEEEVMRDHDPAEEEKVMKKCEGCDEDTVQRKEEEESVMKKEDEEESVMKKEEEESVMKMDDGGKGGIAPAAVEQGIQSSKGQGNPLPQNVQQDIGPKMGADLSDVRVHTGSHAHEMSTAINAKAFTHGQDVYFKNGNYDTSSSSGKALLTHELAHTQQQKGGVDRKVQRQYAGDTLTADDKKFLKDNFDIVTDPMPLADQKKLAKGMKAIREMVMKNPPHFLTGATSSTFNYKWQEGDAVVEVTKTYDKLRNPESVTFSYKSPTFKVTSKKQFTAQYNPMQSPVNNSGGQGNQQSSLYQSGTDPLAGIESPHLLPADEVYQTRDNYPHVSESLYDKPKVGEAYDNNHRSEVMDSYVMDLRHDDRPARKYQKVYAYRRDLYVKLEDGRTVHIKVDGDTFTPDAKASANTYGYTEVDIEVEVYGGEGEPVEVKGYFRGNGSVNSAIYKLALEKKVPAGLLTNGVIDDAYMRNAKQYADRVMAPIEKSLWEEWFGEDKEEEKENKESEEAKPFEDMTKDEKKSKAWRDVWRKTSGSDIAFNALIAVIGIVVLAIVAILFGWEAALIVGLVVLIGGFLMEYLNAKDDEEKLNIIVRYIAYVVLAIFAIFAIPFLAAAGLSTLVAGLIVGAIAAVVLCIIGLIFVWRRVDRASEAKTPEDFEKETDQGAEIVETTIVEIIASILSGVLPPLGDRVPPGWRDRWNPFKHRPLLPPDINPPGGNKGGQSGTQKGGPQKTTTTKTTTTTKKVQTPKTIKSSYLVDYKGNKVPVYRGGKSFTVKPNEVKINPTNGNVKTSHGLSLDVNPNTVSKFGGAYKIKSLPSGLKIIQRGSRPEHFEIVPSYEMPMAEFQKLLNQIQVEP